MELSRAYKGKYEYIYCCAQFEIIRENINAKNKTTDLRGPIQGIQHIYIYIHTLNHKIKVCFYLLI